MGYGKPPVHSRFRPGQSGNPRGRPRGARNRARVPGPHEERLKSIILQEAYRPVSVKDAKGQVNMPLAQAVVRAVGLNAVKGSQWAQRHFTELLSATERDNKQQNDELLKTGIQYKRSWEDAIEYCRKHGLPEPDPIPHPDHVIVDLRTATVRFTGPVTKEDKALLERVRRNIRDSESELAFLREQLAKDSGSERWKEEIEWEEYTLALLRWNEQLLTGADPNDLVRPVRPPSVQRRMAEHKNRLKELAKRRSTGPVRGSRV